MKSSDLHDAKDKSIQLRACLKFQPKKEYDKFNDDSSPFIHIQKLTH